MAVIAENGLTHYKEKNGDTLDRMYRNYGLYVTVSFAYNNIIKYLSRLGKKKEGASIKQDVAKCLVYYRRITELDSMPVPKPSGDPRLPYNTVFENAKTIALILDKFVDTLPDNDNELEDPLKTAETITRTCYNAIGYHD